MLKIMSEKPDAGVALVRLKRPMLEEARHSVALLEEDDSQPSDVWRLFRKYFVLALLLGVMGELFGLTCVIFQTPLYRTRVLLEVQPVSTAVMSQGMDPFAAVNNMDEVNVQTQISLLQSGPSMGRVMSGMEHIRSEQPRDAGTLFGSLRMLLRPNAAKEAVSTPRALSVAASSFSARSLSQTRLIELSCESTQPAIASEFVNRVAMDFAQEAIRDRLETSSKTKEWLSSHIDDTRLKLQDADEKLRSFALKSGNIFAGNELTVDDVKLKQFQTDLAAAESNRLAKQARYESASKEEGEAVTEVVQDSAVAAIRVQIAELERQRAILLVTLTPNNPKVISLDEQAHERKAALRAATSNVIGRLKNEYEDAQRHESLLIAAYSREGSQVNSQAAKAEEYATLRREVDRLQKSYDSLLQEMTRTEVSQSAPVAPVRLVEPSAPPREPYKPNPSSMLIMGIIGGLTVTIGIAFIREKTDRRIHSPESVQTLLRVPQLGVIPSLGRAETTRSEKRLLSIAKSTDAGVPGLLPVKRSSSVLGDSGAVARAAWDSGSIDSSLANSFRATLVSLMRNLNTSEASKVVLITSSLQGEGKTTVASNLGIALSEAGRSVVVVDADFRNPSLSKVFGVSSARTLSQILWEMHPMEEYKLEDLVCETNFAGLKIVPSVSARTDLTRLIHSNRLPELIARLKREFEFVILDAPPILFSADARVVSEYVDGVVLVVRSGKSDREAIRAAVTCLQDDRIPLLGTVLTDWTPSGSRSAYYYSYYASARDTAKT